MSKAFLPIVLLFAIVFSSQVIQAQDGKTQLKLGLSTYLKEPGMTVQIGRSLGTSGLKITGNFHRSWSEALIEVYDNGQLITSYTDALIFNMYSVLAEYLFIASRTKNNQGLSIGFGPGYTYASADQLDYHNGPGLAAKLEFQGQLKNNWYYGAESYLIYFADQNDKYRPDEQVLFTMPLNLTIGFWY